MKYCRGDFELITHLVSTVNHVATGIQVRNARVASGISLRQLARYMDISPPFLSDLERGRRNWSDERIDQWWKAFATAQKKEG